MADKTGIEWTDATWNPIVGCSVVSPGCTNCYAMRMAERIEAMGGAPHYAGLTQPSKVGAVWTGKVALAPERILTQPLRWTRGRKIFVNSMGDLFAEGVPDTWIDQVFEVMASCRQHAFQVLTKRPARARAYLSRFKPCRAASGFLTRDGDEPTNYGGPVDRPIFAGDRWPLPNLWLGVSAEDQARADERIPELLATPAAVRFVSAEPLLAPIDLREIHPDDRYEVDALIGFDSDNGAVCERIDWVIAGGESGPGARPMHPGWARSLRDQCSAARVPFFFKQWGEWTPGENVGRKRGAVEVASLSNYDDGWRFAQEDLADCDGHVDDEPDLYRVGKRAAGRLLDGVEHLAYPETRS
jgi:protein gp37